MLTDAPFDMAEGEVLEHCDAWCLVLLLKRGCFCWSVAAVWAEPIVHADWCTLWHGRGWSAGTLWCVMLGAFVEAWVLLMQVLLLCAVLICQSVQMWSCCYYGAVLIFQSVQMCKAWVLLKRGVAGNWSSRLVIRIFLVRGASWHLTKKLQPSQRRDDSGSVEIPLRN